jgi:hypothetical protein
LWEIAAQRRHDEHINLLQSDHDPRVGGGITHDLVANFVADRISNHLDADSIADYFAHHLVADFVADWISNYLVTDLAADRFAHDVVAD